MFEHKGSVQHSKDGGRVERPSYVFSAHRNDLSEMFHSTLSLKMDTSFGSVFELNNVEHQHLGIALLRFAAVSIRRNWVISLDKSILYLQFLCKMSHSTIALVVHDYVWDRFCCKCAEVNNFLTGPTPQVTNRELFGRQIRSLYVQENAHKYFVFHSIFTRFVAL